MNRNKRKAGQGGEFVMLIDFSLRNWRSFGEKAGFSLLPSGERRFAWTLPAFASAPRRLLPIALFYGANASGKSNLLSGLHFLAHLVICGREVGEETGVDTYQLDPDKISEPILFSVLFRTHEHVYQYEMVLTKKEILKERLLRISGKKEIVLFDRNRGRMEFHQSVWTQRADFVFEGTQDNTPFITSAYRQRIDFVAEPYLWFKNSLVFIDANQCYEDADIFENNSSFQERLSEYLARYDTGIHKIVSRESIFRNDEFFDSILKDMVSSTDKRFVQVRKTSDTISVRKLYFVRKDRLGNNVFFDVKNESAGIKRLLDLLQILVNIEVNENDEQVYIVDEIDRSLHVHLLSAILSDYLGMCSARTRVQLVASTQAPILMNRDLLRCDEIWLTEKKAACSTLYSLAECKSSVLTKSLPVDRIMEKLYREGRLGGVPKIVIPPLPVYKKLED